MRRFYNLPLVSNNNPTFSLSWTAMHQISERSPLHKLGINDIREKNILFFVSITGIDDVISTNIHSNHRYTSDEIFEAKKFVDILDSSIKNQYILDYTKFHDIE